MVGAVFESLVKIVSTFFTTVEIVSVTFFVTVFLTTGAGDAEDIWGVAELTVVVEISSGIGCM
jgi:hypothetical protein